MKENFVCDAQTFSRLWEAIPCDTGYPLRVTGGSMTPFLRDGRSVVTIEKRKEYRPRRGDIILFRRVTGDYVLHRVCRREKDGTLTVCGDAQTWTERVAPPDVCAIVTRVRRTEREVPVTALSYRAAVFFWMMCRPVRRPLLQAAGLLLRRRGKTDAAAPKNEKPRNGSGTETQK